MANSPKFKENDPEIAKEKNVIHTKKSTFVLEK